jgi:hypothetical protein
MHDEQRATAYLWRGQFARRILDEVQVAVAPQTQPMINNFVCTVISSTYLQTTGLNISYSDNRTELFLSSSLERTTDAWCVEPRRNAEDETQRDPMHAGTNAQGVLVKEYLSSVSQDCIHCLPKKDKKTAFTGTRCSFRFLMNQIILNLIILIISNK